MLDKQMLEAMWESGTATAAEDIGDEMPYDLDYAYEHADAIAKQVAHAAHLTYADVRELATEWLGGYKERYADEMQ